MIRLLGKEDMETELHLPTKREHRPFAEYGPCLCYPPNGPLVRFPKIHPRREKSNNPMRQKGRLEIGNATSTRAGWHPLQLASRFTPVRGGGGCGSATGRAGPVKRVQTGWKRLGTYLVWPIDKAIAGRLFRPIFSRVMAPAWHQSIPIQSISKALRNSLLHKALQVPPEGLEPSTL